MQIGLGRRYALYLSAATLAGITFGLTAAGILAFREANILQTQIRQAVVAIHDVDEDARLTGQAQYLAARLFNPVFRLDVERIDEEIEQVRRWLPVREFLVTGPDHRVITDGTYEKTRFGETISGTWPSAESGALLIGGSGGPRQIRFAIGSGGTLAGFGSVTFAEEPGQISLRRIDEQTSGLWSSHRTSLLTLFVIALGLSIAIGAITSARLSRSLSRPLSDMSRAAAAFAEGRLDQSLPTDSPDELGDLARALRRMSEDVRTHQAALQEETARLRRAEAERTELLADLSRKNAELERFAYTVSHDLKSPLVTIQGFAGMIASELGPGAPEGIRRDLDRIMNAAQRMQSLLTDLLELSRIGRIVNPVEAVRLDDLAREAAELVQGQLSASHAEVAVEPDLPVIRVDRRRMVEVLQNLLENATKFVVPERPPRVEIGLRRGEERAFFVRDNGQGIDPAYAERIFNIFEKLHPGGDGSGIGLALVKRIVEAHGGRVWVESAGPGTGCTFLFTLGPKAWEATPS